MTNLIPVLTLPQPTEMTTAWMLQKLLNFGFIVEQTFDLKTARLAHLNYPCPYHGTQDCTCQLVILIVHIETQCATVIVHGRDNQTSIALVDGNEQSIHRKVTQALLPSLPSYGIESPEPRD